MVIYSRIAVTAVQIPVSLVQFHVSESDDLAFTITSLLIFWTGAERVPPLGFPDRLKIAFYSRQVV